MGRRAFAVCSGRPRQPSPRACHFIPAAHTPICLCVCTLRLCSSLWAMRDLTPGALALLLCSPHNALPSPALVPALPSPFLLPSPPHSLILFAHAAHPPAPQRQGACTCSACHPVSACAAHFALRPSGLAPARPVQSTVLKLAPIGELKTVGGLTVEQMMVALLSRTCCPAAKHTCTHLQAPAHFNHWWFTGGGGFPNVCRQRPCGRGRAPAWMYA